MVVTAGASTPTVSQVGIVPGGGASSNRQRRHGVARDPPATVSHGASSPVVWGRMANAAPTVPRAPP